MSAASGKNQSDAVDHAVGPRRIWFPVLWPIALASIWWFVWRRSADAGVPNSLFHVLVGVGTAGLAIWTVRSSGLSTMARWSFAGVLLALVGSFYAQLWPIRMDINGDVGIVGWSWRGAAAPDRLLDAPTKTAAKMAEWEPTSHDYPRFLGNGYWASAAETRIDRPRLAAQPKERWRVKIGAGWSGFAVVGDYGFTQEQRGDNELVSCYDLRDGSIVWSHADPVRWDPRGGGALGGAGPRATPTAHAGRIFSHGATGILNCIDARSGALIWSHDTLAENNASNVAWGKSGSPLIVESNVVVSVGASGGHSLAAYDLESGQLTWSAGDMRSSYASPVLAELGGTRQILTVNEGYLAAHRADDGAILWSHPWDSHSDSSAATSQPVPVGNDRVFLSKGYGLGSTLIQVSQTDAEQWKTKPLWRGPRGIRPVMKTKMGNVVIHQGHVYGLDNTNLQCIELATGRSKWKKRRSPDFGHGQIMLVDDLVLLLSEQGEVIFIEPSSKEYREIHSFQALEGVTWNNPAVAGNMLLVRNARWAACYELPVVDKPGTSTEFE